MADWKVAFFQRTMHRRFGNAEDGRHLGHRHEWLGAWDYLSWHRNTPPSECSPCSVGSRTALITMAFSTALAVFSWVALSRFPIRPNKHLSKPEPAAQNPDLGSTDRLWAPCRRTGCRDITEKGSTEKSPGSSKNSWLLRLLFWIFLIPIYMRRISCFPCPFYNDTHSGDDELIGTGGCIPPGYVSDGACL